MLFLSPASNENKLHQKHRQEKEGILECGPFDRHLNEPRVVVQTHCVVYLSNVFFCVEGANYREFPKAASRNRAGFLNFGTVDILGQIVLYFRELSCPWENV